MVREEFRDAIISGLKQQASDLNATAWLEEFRDAIISGLKQAAIVRDSELGQEEFRDAIISGLKRQSLSRLGHYQFAKNSETRLLAD